MGLTYRVLFSKDLSFKMYLRFKVKTKEIGRQFSHKECLLCNHEDWSLDPGTHITRHAMHAYNSNSKGAVKTGGLLGLAIF